MDLSIVIPIKDECANIARLYERLKAALASLDRSYEIVVVDDGSRDGSYAALEAVALVDRRVKVVRLGRNFGQTPALQAGIDHAAGAIIVTMDGDLQNDAADIPALLAKLDEGYDAVFGLRAHRQDHFLMRTIPSRIANWLIRKVTRTDIEDLGCTLRAMRRELAEGLPLYGEMHRFIGVLIQQSGAKVAQIPVRHHPRTAGQTKYTLSRAFRVVLDLITVKFLHSYLTRPMHVMGLAGLISMGLGFVTLVAVAGMKIGLGTDMSGNPLLLLSALFELVGVQFISMGLIGEMMARTYFESQGKKAYTVRNTLNVEPLKPRDEPDESRGSRRRQAA